VLVVAGTLVSSRAENRSKPLRHAETERKCIMPAFEHRQWWSWLKSLTIETRCSLIEQLYLAGWLTDYMLWDVLGSEASPIPAGHAAGIYETLGLEPFAGYPLQASPCQP